MSFFVRGICKVLGREGILGDVYNEFLKFRFRMVVIAMGRLWFCFMEVARIDLNRFERVVVYLLI